MQKNSSQLERYMKGINRNVKGNLVAGAIIIFVMMIVHLMSGCEPILPDESPANKVSNFLLPDSVEENTDINEWDVDTIVYHSEAKPSSNK